LRNIITKTESTWPKLHIATSQEIQIFQNRESHDENDASASGGSNSNPERHVQDRKSVHEKKQPNWMTSGEFVCQADDSQGNYCSSPISCTEAMQSNEQKQWMKAMNEELASLKEN
jgi:hypothetical protein